MTTVEQFLTAALGITWGGIGLSFAVGKWAKSREAGEASLQTAQTVMGAALLYRIEQMEKRMDKAGGHISDLATAVQGLPETLGRAFRTEFVTRREWDLTERRRIPE